MEKRRSSLKKKVVYSLAAIGAVNAILLAVSVVFMGLAMLIALKHDITPSALGDFSRGYLKFVFATSPIITGLVIVSLVACSGFWYYKIYLPRIQR